MMSGGAAAVTMANREERGSPTTQSLLITREEIINQMDPTLVNQLYESTGGKMVLPQRDQLHRRLQSVQTFVENFCIKPIQKESKNAMNNATTEEKKLKAHNQAR